MLTYKPHLLSKPVDPGIGSAKIIRNKVDLVLELQIKFKEKVAVGGGGGQY